MSVPKHSISAISEVREMDGVWRRDTISGTQSREHTIPQLEAAYIIMIETMTYMNTVSYNVQMNKQRYIEQDGDTTLPSPPLSSL